MKRKIQERLGTTNCGELLKQSKHSLKEVCGPKNGETLYGFLRGEDERQLEAHKERKSVSAEVNVSTCHSLVSNAISTVFASRTRSKRKTSS